MPTLLMSIVVLDTSSYCMLAGMFDPAERECYRCGNKGHDARNCPTIGDPAFDKKRVRLPAGIPVEALTASGTGDLLYHAA